MRLGELVAAAQRLDAAMLQAFVTPVTKQLDLLRRPRADPTAFDIVPRETILRMRRKSPARATTGWCSTCPGIDEAGALRRWAAVTARCWWSPNSPCPRCLAARSLSDEIERDMEPGDKPKIVLNRLASRMFGPAPSMAEAERALQRKAEGGISSDWEAAAASVNLGGPIATHRPKSKIVKDVQTLVERLAAEPVRRHATKAA